MPGNVVKIINKLSNLFGYELKRFHNKKTTFSVQTYDTADIWSKWISAYPVEFAKIYKKNREIQQLVNSWLTREVYESSLWNYGISGTRSLDSLNRVEKNITYTDLLVLFSMFVKDINYLEIGVSAGKNFFQLTKHLENSSLWGLDIEEINPLLETFYDNKRIIWKSDELFDFTNNKGVQVKKQFSLTEFTESYSHNKVYYLCGNKFEQKLWKRLEGEKFNIIFSDACHKSKSIETEMDFLLQYDLIDRTNFIMVWDDISPEMIPSLLTIIEKLKNIFINSQHSFSIMKIHGTYSGNSNGFHNMGIFISDKNIFSDKLQYL